MNGEHSRCILHADMDAFFAAVEQRDQPSLQGKALVIGALPGHRGVVSTASYEARAYGIHSAMPVSHAYARCPHATFLRPAMDKYIEESRRIMALFNQWSPRIEPLSIDEAFIDITGTEKLFGPPPLVARKIQDQIWNERQLTVSIGVAPNKFLAKLASDIKKPAGITVTPTKADDIISWLAPLPVSRIWGVGRKTQHILGNHGISTIGDLQKLDAEYLEKLFGKQGTKISRLCQGIDTRPVLGIEPVKSISREHTFSQDSSHRDEWKATVLTLCRDITRRARRRGVQGSTLTLTWRTPDFQRYSRQKKITPTNLAQKMYTEALALIHKELASVHSIRLIGVGISGFDEPCQLDLFSDDILDSAWEASEQAIDTIVGKFGNDSIKRGGELQDRRQPRKPKV